MGGFATPAFINLGIDATTGKGYPICSRKVPCLVITISRALLGHEQLAIEESHFSSAVLRR